MLWHPTMAYMYMNRRMLIGVEKEHETKVLIYLWHRCSYL